MWRPPGASARLGGAADLHRDGRAAALPQSRAPPGPPAFRPAAPQTVQMSYMCKTCAAPCAAGRRLRPVRGPTGRGVRRPSRTSAAAVGDSVYSARRPSSAYGPIFIHMYDKPAGAPAHAEPRKPAGRHGPGCMLGTQVGRRHDGARAGGRCPRAARRPPRWAPNQPPPSAAPNTSHPLPPPPRGAPLPAPALSAIVDPLSTECDPPD